MLAHKKCRRCLKDLCLLSLELSISEDPRLKAKKSSLKKELLKQLREKFSTGKVPAAIFTDMNRRIKELTGVHDPFRKRKKVEMDTSLRIAQKVRKTHKNSLCGNLLYSAAGNSLDFFKEINHTAAQMQEKIFFAKDHTRELKNRLKAAKTILFFADNSGEMYFDLPLIEYLTKKVRIYYCVKSKPVQNDLTVMDIKKRRMKNKFPDIIASGNDAVGIELKSISKKLKSKLENCDLIIAKGMGYYETFSELPQYRKKVFHLLMAKCTPVAKTIGVKLNDYVFFQARA